jgi:hypothetical protein
LYSKAFTQNTNDTINSSVKGFINVNYLEIFLGELRVEYEKPIKHNISWDLGGGPIYYDYLSRITSELNLNLFHPLWGVGFGLRCGLKIYGENEKSHEGFYLYPLLFIKNFYHKDQPPYNETDNYFTLGAQLLIGYKFHSKKQLSLDFYFGIGDRIIYGNYNTHDPNWQYSGNYKDKLFTPQIGYLISYKLKKK